MGSHETSTDECPQDGNEGGRVLRRVRRASRSEVERRTATVRRWITAEGIAVEEAVRRLRAEYEIGRRQALRYWVRAYLPLLSTEERRRRSRSRPRDRQGRFTSWPSVARAHDPMVVVNA